MEIFCIEIKSNLFLNCEVINLLIIKTPIFETACNIIYKVIADLILVPSCTIGDGMSISTLSLPFINSNNQ
jgi:hypothetical protein